MTESSLPRLGPKPRSLNWRRISSLVGSGALLAGALAYIGFVDPHREGSVFPLCPFRLLTGWNCPACGGLRMTHDLLHGNLAAAVTDNAFLLIGILVLAAWIVLRRRRGKAVSTIPTLVVIAVATLGWTLLRNLPGFPLVPIVLTG